MKRLWIVLLTLLLAGCTTTKSGVEKRYDMAINNSGGGFVILTVSLDAETQTDTKSGDAGASTEIDPAIALGMQGSTTSAAAKGAEQALKEIISYAEQRLRQNTDNPTTNTTETINEGDEVVKPVPTTDPEGDSEKPSKPGEPPEGVVATADCDGTMSYRECDTCTSVPQKVCMFDQYATCNDVPVNGFTLQFVDSAGNTRELSVPDKCGIAMGQEAEGFIKWRYEHDKAPNKPVGYAPRGFNATEARILK